MNIYDIAKLSGVSIATVSRVLNNKPGVSENARNKVMSVVDETDFIPNQLAKSLANQKSYAIGLVMPGFNDYYSNRVDAINKVCKEEGYSLIITANYKDTNNIEEDLGNFNLLMEKRVDGIIYFPTHVSYPHMELLKKLQHKIPMVITDSLIEEVKVPFVIQDSETPTKEIMDYLIDGGHRRIAYINGLSYDKVNNIRYKTFIKSMEEAGITIDEDYMCLGNYSLKSGYEETLNLLEKLRKINKPMPTAIFAANDKMAMGVMKACLDHNIKVPEETSVIGYDGIDFGQYCYPNLTTVKVNQYKLGKFAAETLIEFIDNPTIGDRKIIMDNEVIIGGSTRTLK